MYRATQLESFPLVCVFQNDAFRSFLSLHLVELSVLTFQDGRIDYKEFVAMMQKGNANLGNRRLPNNFNIGFRDPTKVC